MGQPRYDGVRNQYLQGSTVVLLPAAARIVTATGDPVQCAEFSDAEFDLVVTAIAGRNEIQTVTLTGAPTGGTFTLTYAGQTTAAIAFDATAAAIQAALVALSNLAPGDVVVTGDVGGPFTVTFGGTLAALDVAELTASGASLTGAGSPYTVTIATGTGGVAPTLDVTIETREYSGSWVAIGTAFTQKTAVGSQRLAFHGLREEVRAVGTMSGTTPSMTYSVSGYLK